jgi:hypothetical protein
MGRGLLGWKVIVLALALVVAGGLSAPAMAVTFGIQIDVGFTDNVSCAPPADCVAFSGVGGFPGTFTTMQWDQNTASDVNSFLQISALPDVVAPFVGTATGTINDDGVDVRSLQITHTNNAIPAEDSNLATGQVLFNITIFEDGNPANVLFQAPALIDFSFDETFNQANVADCAAPNPIGTACDDFFTFIALADSSTFTFEGQTYNISTEGLVFANGAFACQPPVNGISQCFTGENQLNDRFVTVAITPVEVPAPATLLLLGLGLLGIGAANVRRTRRDA